MVGLAVLLFTAPPFPLEVLFEGLDFLQILGVGLGGFEGAAVAVEGVVTILGDGLHVRAADRTFAFEHGLVIGSEHAVHTRPPEVEGEVLLLFDAKFGLFEEDDDEAVESVHLVRSEIVLGNNDCGRGNRPTR